MNRSEGTNTTTAYVEERAGPAGVWDRYPVNLSETTRVRIASLRPSDSPRLGGEDEAHVRLLAELETPLPPITVDRETMQVIDGMHRLRAARLRGQQTVDVRFFDGDQRDVFVLAVELNVGHGLPLSRADRTAAAERIIASHPDWSDRIIASIVGVTSRTVATIRSRAVGIASPAERIGRDGRVRPVSSAEGRRRASTLIAANPDAPLREIAALAGIGLGTARDVRQRVRLGLDPVPPQQRRIEQRRNPVPRRLASLDTDERKSRDATTRSASLLGSLRRDPSLRSTEAGRVLLRLLDMQSISRSEWDRITSTVPAHCSGLIAVVARRCADSWISFAKQVEQLAHSAEQDEPTTGSASP